MKDLSPILELSPIQFSIPRVKYNFVGEGRGAGYSICKIQSSNFKLERTPNPIISF